ncbi:hypothetical protein AGMMS49573_03330 [Endomicrobiia bacterium]|nr:hypothetical protein AGMMS49573_03330 [Endomicrobiia bacterium]
MKNHIVAKVMSGCKSSYDRAILKGAAHTPLTLRKRTRILVKIKPLELIVSMFRNDTGLRKELIAEYNYYKLLLEKVDKDSNENK